MPSILRISLSLLAVLCFLAPGEAQNKRLIDSLEMRAQTATVDSMKVLFLNKCAAYYMRYDVGKMPEKLRQAEALTSHFSSNWSDSSSYLRHRAWVRLLYGNYNLRQNNNPEATQYYLEALQLYERTGFHRGVGDSYNGIGSVCYQINDLDKAVHYFNLAAAAFEKAGNLEGTVVVYGNNASILADKGDYKSALELNLKAEKIIVAKKFSKHEGAFYSEITRCYVKLDSMEKARAYLEKARSAFEKVKDLPEYCNHLRSYAEICLQDNKLNEGEEFARQSYQIGLQAGSKIQIEQSCLLLEDIYLRRAKAAVQPALKDSFFLKAFEFSALERVYRDSMYNTEKSLQIAELQVKYETEKKEREISKLNEAAKNQEIEALRREVQLRQEKIRAEQARQQALTLEKDNANLALQYAIQESEIKERDANARDKEHQIESLNNEKQRRETEAVRERQLRYFLLAGLIALALIAFLLLRLYWLKTESNRKISRQKAEIEAQNAQLDEANRFKNIFLSNMSHEIRTPLNTIIGMSRLMSETPLNEKQREFVGIVNQASGNLLNVINEILDFSKIESGKIEFQHRLFNLHELLENQVSLMRYQASEKGLDLSLQTSPDLPRVVSGDAGRLGQILLNLLGNAVKFTENGSVTLQAELVTNSDPGKYLIRFAVKDTGIGISATELPHIFDAFQQAGEDTHLRHSGTGLGLSITRQLVELQGGKIQAESSPGKGTVLSFTLPFAPGEMSEEKSAPAPFQALPTCRILLVEDNSFNQLLATELLQRLIREPEITIAQNGVEAIEKSKENSFDLIFMDIKMPLLDGFAATRAMRANGLITPIVALTANATADEQEKCFREGMNDYLSKPIDPELLYRAVEKWAYTTAGR